MAGVVVVLRLALAGLFAVAGVAKLADRDRLWETLGEFGVPQPFRRAGAWLLPLTELTVAALLVPAEVGRLGALAALGLLTVFCVAIARAIVRGKRPDCNCFGAARSVPIGWTTLARNGILVAAAAVVVVQPVRGPGGIELAAAGAAALALAQGWLWFELLRRYGRALNRIAELESGIDEQPSLEAGDEAPLFALPDVDGRLVSLESLLEESGETVLLFTSPGCGACEVVLAEPAAAGAVVVSNATADGGHHGGTVLLDEESEVMQLYRVAAVPTAVLVDCNGLVAAPPAVGATGVIELVRAAFPLQLAGEAA